LLGFAAGSTPQSITFGSLRAVTYGIAPFTISVSVASQDSGPVSNPDGLRNQME
jgi:hypothetical protein